MKLTKLQEIGNLLHINFKRNVEIWISDGIVTVGMFLILDVLVSGSMELNYYFFKYEILGKNVFFLMFYKYNK